MTPINPPATDPSVVQAIEALLVTLASPIDLIVDSLSNIAPIRPPALTVPYRETLLLVNNEYSSILIFLSA